MTNQNNKSKPLTACKDCKHCEFQPTWNSQDVPYCCIHPDVVTKSFDPYNGRYEITYKPPIGKINQGHCELFE